MKNYCWKSKRAYKPVPAFTVLSWHWSWDFWEYGSELFSVVGGNGAGVWGLRAMTYATVSYRHVKSVWSLYSGMMTRRWSSLLTNVRRAVPCDMACYYIDRTTWSCRQRGGRCNVINLRQPLNNMSVSVYYMRLSLFASSRDLAFIRIVHASHLSPPSRAWGQTAIIVRFCWHCPCSQCILKHKSATLCALRNNIYNNELSWKGAPRGLQLSFYW